MLQSNIFYQTGQDWFETCWKVANTKDAKPTTSDEAVKWAKCDGTANEAVYGAGFVMAGRPLEGVPETIKAVYAACPSAWSDLSIFSGEYRMAVSLIEKNGGPAVLDRFLPATYIIEYAYRSRWPDCSKRRQEAGYPKIVRKSDGAWGFDGECEPCKVEREVAERDNKPINWDRYLVELEEELSKRIKGTKK